MPIPESFEDKEIYVAKKFIKLEKDVNSKRYKNVDEIVEKACKIMLKFNKKLQKQYFKTYDKLFNKYTGIPKDIMEHTGFRYEKYDSYEEKIIIPKLESYKELKSLILNKELHSCCEDEISYVVSDMRTGINYYAKNGSHGFNYRYMCLDKSGHCTSSHSVVMFSIYDASDVYLYLYDSVKSKLKTLH